MFSQGPFEEKENSGHLFKNKQKTKDTQPDFRGHCKINGKVLEISGWTKVKVEGKFAGEKFVSLSFKTPFVPNPAYRKERPPQQQVESDEVF